MSKSFLRVPLFFHLLLWAFFSIDFTASLPLLQPLRDGAVQVGSCWNQPRKKLPLLKGQLNQPFHYAPSSRGEKLLVGLARCSLLSPPDHLLLDERTYAPNLKKKKKAQALALQRQVAQEEKKNCWSSCLHHGWKKIKEGYATLVRGEKKPVTIIKSLCVGGLLLYSYSLLPPLFVQGQATGGDMPLLNTTLLPNHNGSSLFAPPSSLFSPELAPLYYQVSHDLCYKVDEVRFQNYCQPNLQALRKVAAAMRRGPEHPPLRYEYKMMQEKKMLHPQQRDWLRYKPGRKKRRKNQDYIEKIAQIISEEQVMPRSTTSDQRHLLGLLQGVYGRGGTTRSDWASKIVAIDSSNHYVAVGLENTNGEGNEAFIALFDRDMLELARTKFGISGRRDYAEGVGCIVQAGTVTLWDCYVAGETRGIPPTNQYDAFIVRFQVDLGNLTFPFSRVSEVAIGGAQNDQIKDVLPFRYSQARYNGTLYNRTILLALLFEPITTADNGRERIMALLPEDGYVVKDNIGFSGVTNRSYEAIALEQTTEEEPPLIVFVGWIVNSNGEQATLKEFFWGHNFTFLTAKVFQNNQGDNNLAYAISSYRRGGEWVTLAAGSYEENGYPYIRGEICVGLPPFEPVAHCVTFMGDDTPGSEANDLYARGVVYLPDYDFIFIAMSSDGGFSCNGYCNLYVLCDYAFTNCTAVVKDEVNDDWVNSITNSITGRDGTYNDVGGGTVVGCGKTRIKASSGSRNDEAYFLWRLNNTLESLFGNCGRAVHLVYGFRNFSLLAGTTPKPLPPVNTFPYPFTLKPSVGVGQYIICEMRLPSSEPTKMPSRFPTLTTTQPTGSPSEEPTVLTLSPSDQPSTQTASPSLLPTSHPTGGPTFGPTVLPSHAPTVLPSLLPTSHPTGGPTFGPTVLPSHAPTVLPSLLPTSHPTGGPTLSPTVLPSHAPTVLPSLLPTSHPTGGPTLSPTVLPSHPPTVLPSLLPTSHPTGGPTLSPTVLPSQPPTLLPSLLPTSHPTGGPTLSPTVLPSHPPTVLPSLLPTSHPTGGPTLSPTVLPSQPPTLLPGVMPTGKQSLNATDFPTKRATSETQNVTAGPTALPLNLYNKTTTKKTEKMAWEKKYFAFERNGKSSMTYALMIMAVMLLSCSLFGGWKYYRYKKMKNIHRVRAELNSFENTVELIEL